MQWIQYNKSDIDSEGNDENNEINTPDGENEIQRQKEGDQHTILIPSASDYLASDANEGVLPLATVSWNKRYSNTLDEIH